MSVKSGFVIGGASSGSGKTTLTLGLLRALYRRKVKVAPYKCGPDYIDPLIHQKAAHTPCYNLDAFFIPETEQLKRHFAQTASQADVCVVEGVMGLFDGYERSKGSSAEMAKKLGLPVILIIDAKAVAYSIAAPLYGFKHFDPDLRIAGVIFNRTGSEHHYELLCDAARSIGIEPLGYIPKDSGLEISSRHLGLTIDPDFDWERLLNHAADMVEKHVDIDRILSCCILDETSLSHKIEQQTAPQEKQTVVAIARDEAFNFTYQANIDKISSMAQIVYFSPIHDSHLPDCDFLYLPGGYPEFFAEQLSRNESMKTSIAKYAENGGKIWAECGGMMYLTEALITEDEVSHPMAGILPAKATMVNKKMRLGYRSLNINGIEYRGHEFHYSHLTHNPGKSMAVIYDSKGNPTETGLWRIKNVYAGYTHIYWEENTSPFMLFD